MSTSKPTSKATIQTLYDALKSHDETAVAEALKTIHPESEMIDGYSILFHSAIGDNIDLHIARILLAAGADPNRKQNYTGSPFQEAIQAMAFASARLMLDFGADIYSVMPTVDQTPLDHLLQGAKWFESDIASKARQIAFLQELGAVTNAQLPVDLFPSEQANRSLTITGRFDMGTVDMRNHAHNGKKKALQQILSTLDADTAKRHATTVIQQSGTGMPLLCLEILLKAGADPNSVGAHDRSRSAPIEHAASCDPIDEKRVRLYVQHGANINIRSANTGLTILDRRLNDLQKSKDGQAALLGLIDELKRRGAASSAPQPHPAIPSADLAGIETQRGAVHFNDPWLCPTLILAHASPQQLLTTLDQAKALQTQGTWSLNAPPDLPPLSFLFIRLKGHQWSFALVPGYAPTKSQAKDLSKLAAIKTLFIEHDGNSDSDSAYVFKNGRILEQTSLTSDRNSCKSSLRQIKVTSKTTPQEYYDGLLKFLDAMAVHAMIEKPDGGPLKLNGPFNAQTVEQAIWITPNEGILEPD